MKAAVGSCTLVGLLACVAGCGSGSSGGLKPPPAFDACIARASFLSVSRTGAVESISDKASGALVGKLHVFGSNRAAVAAYARLPSTRGFAEQRYQYVLFTTGTAPDRDSTAVGHCADSTLPKLP
jgi:hypothetical protein